MAPLTLHNECVSAGTQKHVRTLRTALKPFHFVLAGGTALALYLGHRVSVDLDFFSEDPFSTENIYREIGAAGLNPLVLQEEKGTLTLSIAETKVSFFHYPYPFVEKKVKWKGLSVAGVIDIAAMKLLAIAQRGARRDFVDLYYISQDIPFRKIAENVVRRFGGNRINPVHLGKSLIYFVDAECDPDPQYVGRSRLVWKEVKQFFVKNVRQMVLDLEAAKKEI